jgi:chromosome partitioning protein
LTPKETISFEELFISNVYEQEALVNLLQKVRSHLEDKVFKTVIPNNITLADAPSFGKTTFEYRPDSHGAEDYLALCREIIKRE